MQKPFERFDYAMTLLDKEIKFDNAVEIELDRSEAACPNHQARLNELWRHCVKYEALMQKLTYKEWAEIKEVLEKR
ncbi:hypothetical protein UF34_04595 [Vibrio parahaemolyticus]|nr:hypothetical protein UF34_04595 [Vibrio parahaemolyticus]